MGGIWPGNSQHKSSARRFVSRGLSLADWAQILVLLHVKLVLGHLLLSPRRWCKDETIYFKCLEARAQNVTVLSVTFAISPLFSWLISPIFRRRKDAFNLKLINDYLGAGMDLRNHGIGAPQRPTTWVGETPYPKGPAPTQPHVSTAPEISDLLKFRYF